MMINRIIKILFLILIINGIILGNGKYKSQNPHADLSIDKIFLYNKNNDLISFEETGKESKKGLFLLSAGANFSSYLNVESDWQIGYKLGLTFNIRRSKSLSFTLQFFYSRINTTANNVEGIYWDNNIIKKKITDWQISVAFIDLPILISYKFYDAISYNLKFNIGPGLTIAIKDHSSKTNINLTDEIIDANPTYPEPLEPEESEYEFPYSNSGYNLNSGIRFQFERYYLDLLYTMYPYKIKSINNIHNISLIFSLDLE